MLLMEKMGLVEMIDSVSIALGIKKSSLAPRVSEQNGSKFR